MLQFLPYILSISQGIIYLSSTFFIQRMACTMYLFKDKGVQQREHFLSKGLAYNSAS